MLTIIITAIIAALITWALAWGYYMCKADDIHNQLHKELVIRAYKEENQRKALEQEMRNLDFQISYYERELEVLQHRLSMREEQVLLEGISKIFAGRYVYRTNDDRD